MVLGKGRLQVGGIAKHDETQPVPGSLIGQLPQHGLYGDQTINRLAIGAGEIPGLHRARQIHGDHQVPPGFLLFYGGPQPLGLGCGGDQRQPHQCDQHLLPPSPDQQHGSALGPCFCGNQQALEKRHPDGIPALPIGRQQGHDYGEGQ